MVAFTVFQMAAVVARPALITFCLYVASAVASMGSGRSPMYTRQQLDADTNSQAEGKPAATPAATRESRSVVLVVHTTCSRRLLVATGYPVLKVTVTCSFASPETRYALEVFSRTSYP